jgi:NarL family two-component system response regulator LiaR
VIRIVIADDHQVVRQGLRFLLSQEADFQVVAEAADGISALETVRRLRPDVLLLDLFMPRLGGMAVLRAIQDEALGAKVLVLTSSQNEDHLLEAVRAGALSFLPKTARVDQVVESVRAASRGESVLEPSGTARLLREIRGRSRRDPLATLSPRELDVLKALARGRSNREIARALSVTEETIKSHVSNILAKLGLADRTQAAIYGLQHHLVSLDQALEE